MTVIDAKTLTEGMLFSAPVFFDDGKNMFVAEKLPVEKFHLEAIKRWSIKKLVTYGKQIDSVDDLGEDLEELDDVDEVEDLEEI